VNFSQQWPNICKVLGLPKITKSAIFDAVARYTMIDLNRAVARARTSSLHLRLLNLALDRIVPFNRPHGFRIVEIGDDHIITLVPYRKRNLNHIKGLHACAMATLSEFTTGFLLLTRLDSSKYRLIMQRLEMEYHYQGKMDAMATYSITKEAIQQQILDPLATRDSVVIVCEIKIHDQAGNHLTTGKVHWQIKEWGKVKTKK
jgi:acyl-coenzyme A thioesterase PaaI-like protein